jgi:hypothetical protein
MAGSGKDERIAEIPAPMRDFLDPLRLSTPVFLKITRSPYVLGKRDATCVIMRCSWRARRWSRLRRRTAQARARSGGRSILECGRELLEREHVETRQQGSTLFSAVLVLIAMLVVIQLWLVAAALDALLARQIAVLVPTAIASLVLFILSGGLLWYVVSFDARLRQWGPRG